MHTISILINEETEAALDRLFSECETGSWSLVKSKDQGIRLQGFFSSAEDAASEWLSLQKKVPSLPVACTPLELDNEDWKSAYKKYLKPWSADDLHWVPLWEKDAYIVPEGHTAIYLDAGMAFGTGTHETTQLCAKRILDFKDKHREFFAQKNIIDAGCGSGILAISAAKLGCQHLSAFDIDPDAIRVSEENCIANQLSPESIRFYLADIQTGLNDNKADLIVANIQADVLCQNAQTILEALKPNAVIAMSGILKMELKQVCELYEQVASELGLTINTHTRELGEWADLQIERA